jgi:anti-anti-sigma factor
MALEIAITDKKLTVVLDDELTIYTANDFRDLLTEQIQDITHIVINLSKVTEMDSAGLQLLFAIKNMDTKYDVEFVEHSSAVTEVLELCGMLGQLNDSVLILRESV